MKKLSLLFFILFLLNGIHLSSAYLPGTLEDGLLSYWKLENDFLDYLGKHNGTSQGTLTYTSQGKVGGAYNFNGIDSCISVPTAAATFNNLTEGSISLWFKFNSPDVNEFRPLIYLGTNDSDSDSVIIEVGHPGAELLLGTRLYFTVSVAGSDEPVWCYDSDSSLAAGEWHHFVATVDSTGNTGYLNGVEMTSRDYNFGTSSSTEFFDDVTDAALFTIGYGMFVIPYQFYYFNGTIDEVGIWNRSLSASEVTELFSWANATTTTTTTTTTTSTTTTTTTTTSTTLATGEITCNSCSDCSDKLDGSYDVVKLTTDIVDESSGCIQFGSGYVEFDCQGHTIDGQDSGTGINIADSVSIWNAEVKNCRISDFQYGIRLLNAYGCTITNNVINSNPDKGIYLENSGLNSIDNNTANENQYGLLISGGYNINYITDNTFNSNTWIGLYLGNVDVIRMNRNEVCYNSESDFWLYNSLGLGGINNTCSNPHLWNDTNMTGCTFQCAGVTTTTTTTTTSTTTTTIPDFRQHNLTASVSSNSANISWYTTRPSTDYLKYGLDTNYGTTVWDYLENTYHNVFLDNLTTGVTYHYRIVSQEGYPYYRGITSDDYTFMTVESGTGDINSDDFVNLLDLAMLGQAYNSVDGDANWNSAADLNSDGSVNLFDLAILGQSWGNQY